MENWAYGFSLNHEGAGVGTIYYSKKYFEREGIVNPANAQPYSLDEIDRIKNGAVDGATNYTSNVPVNALIGMNVLNTDKVFWYDEENSNKILASADPLLLDKETGDMKTTGGDIIAKAM
ncbi:MAG: hypothetical protein IJ220_04025 [Clostridia bacterium]|nr:hypothetical protein [Clostridia bacterium]